MWLEQGEPGGVIEMAEAISGGQNIWGLPQAEDFAFVPRATGCYRKALSEERKDRSLDSNLSSIWQVWDGALDFAFLGPQMLMLLLQDYTLTTTAFPSRYGRAGRRWGEFKNDALPRSSPG